jgi:predicted transcriptional regulator
MGSIFDALTPPSDESDARRGMADVLSLPDEERELVTWLLRQREVTLAEVGEHLDRDLTEAERLLVNLENKGFVERVPMTNPARFRSQRMAKHTSRLGSDLWRALDDSAGADKPKG